MKKRRLDRVNSLLRKVIFEVIQKDVKNPHIDTFVSVISVDTSADLHHAKVQVSVLGTNEKKQKILTALQSAAGFIAIHASKKVELRYFPELIFKLDTSIDQHMRIEEVLSDIHQEQQSRPDSSSTDHVD